MRNILIAHHPLCSHLRTPNCGIGLHSESHPCLIPLCFGMVTIWFWGVSFVLLLCLVRAWTWIAVLLFLASSACIFRHLIILFSELFIRQDLVSLFYIIVLLLMLFWDIGVVLFAELIITFFNFLQACIVLNHQQLVIVSIRVYLFICIWFWKLV